MSCPKLAFCFAGGGRCWTRRADVPLLLTLPMQAPLLLCRWCWTCSSSPQRSCCMGCKLCCVVMLLSCRPEGCGVHNSLRGVRVLVTKGVVCQSACAADCPACCVVGRVCRGPAMMVSWMLRLASSGFVHKMVSRWRGCCHSCLTCVSEIHHVAAVSRGRHDINALREHAEA